jgi:hypothetical protein
MELVDTELGAMGVARQIGQAAQRTIDQRQEIGCSISRSSVQARERGCRARRSAVPAGGADEGSGEQIRERRMVCQ